MATSSVRPRSCMQRRAPASRRAPALPARAGYHRPDVSTTRGAVYFGGLDGLRFVAAYAVLVHHVEQTLEMHGYASAFDHPVIERIGIEAVHFFFVLSGYLITYLL